MQTVADLLECFRVYAVCIHCARMEPVDLNKVDPQTTVDALRRRLKCSGCGVRREDIRIVYVGPCARAAAFRYRR